MEPKQQVNEATPNEHSTKTSDEPSGPPEASNAGVGTIARFPSRTFMRLVLGVILLFVVAFCVLSVLSSRFLSCEWKPPHVELLIENLCLCPKPFAVLRVHNCSTYTLWYYGCLHQHPYHRVEYLADGNLISWQLNNGPVSDEKIPLRAGETFLLVVPLAWDAPPKKQPETVRVGMPVYRNKSAPGDISQWFWTPPIKLQ